MTLCIPSHVSPACMPWLTKEQQQQERRHSSARGLPGNVVEDLVEGASSIKVAPQEQIAEAAVVVQRDVAACSHKFQNHDSCKALRRGWPMPCCQYQVRWSSSIHAGCWTTAMLTIGIGCPIMQHSQQEWTEQPNAVNRPGPNRATSPS